MENEHGAWGEVMDFQDEASSEASITSDWVRDQEFPPRGGIPREDYEEDEPA
jgi:hypothetical protein